MTASVMRRAAAAMALFAALWCFSVPADPAVRLCGFHWLTGRPCPLCGLTRALFALFWNGRTREWLWRGGVAAFAVYGLWRVFLPAPL